MIILRRIWPYLLVLGFIMPLIWPLVHPGFFVSDDGSWMIIRLSAFNQALKTGQFPVRFLDSLNHGYGYPVMDFLYPLPFYLGELVHLAGFGFITSVKILFGASFLFSAMFMYLFVQKAWGTWSGITAAILYAWLPYRLFDVYQRGSLGETMAFIFIPLIFYFINRLVEDKQLIFIVSAALSLAALIASHNTVAFIFLPVIVVFCGLKFFSSPNRKPLVPRFVAFFVLAFGVSCWFWLPALFDLQFTKAGEVLVANFADYFITSQNFTTTLGILAPLVLVMTVLVIWHRNSSRIALFFLLVTLVSVFLASSFSRSLWQVMPLLQKLVQFPWRFLSITVFGSSVLAGFLVKQFSAIKVNIGLALILIVLSLVTSYSLLKINPTTYPETYYTTNDDTTTVKNEYMPIWVKTDPTARPATTLVPVSGQATIIGSTVVVQTPTILQINLVYFPGLQILANGQPQNITYQDNGFPKISLALGQYAITSKFTETTPRLVADLISLASILSCGVLLFL